MTSSFRNLLHLHFVYCLTNINAYVVLMVRSAAGPTLAQVTGTLHMFMSPAVMSVLPHTACQMGLPMECRLIWRPFAWAGIMHTSERPLGQPALVGAGAGSGRAGSGRAEPAQGDSLKWAGLVVKGKSRGGHKRCTSHQHPSPTAWRTRLLPPPPPWYHRLYYILHKASIYSNHTVFEWDTFMCWFHGCYHGRYTDI